MHPEDAHTRGYSDGFHRRPPRSQNPIYLAAYALGMRAPQRRPCDD